MSYFWGNGMGGKGGERGKQRLLSLACVCHALFDVRPFPSLSVPCRAVPCSAVFLTRRGAHHVFGVGGKGLGPAFLRHGQQQVPVKEGSNAWMAGVESSFVPALVIHAMQNLHAPCGRHVGIERQRLLQGGDGLVLLAQFQVGVGEVEPHIVEGGLQGQGAV